MEIDCCFDHLFNPKTQHYFLILPWHILWLNYFSRPSLNYNKYFIYPINILLMIITSESKSTEISSRNNLKFVVRNFVEIGDEETNWFEFNWGNYERKIREKKKRNWGKMGSFIVVWLQSVKQKQIKNKAQMLVDVVLATG